MLEQEVLSLLTKEAIKCVLMLKLNVTQIRSQDRFVTIDLKDVYVNISILPQDRKFLRFAYRSEAYQDHFFPFGIALLPHTFTKAPLQEHPCIQLL